MKSSKSKLPPRNDKSKRPSKHVVFNTVVREGDLITFDPTGEQLKITKIEGGKITIEKRP